MWKEIIEGRTKLIVPEKGKFGKTETGKLKRPPVFYNPRMELNRSVCCAAVKTLQEKEEIKFLDLLAGSGAKGIRIANEAGCEVHLNDANEKACELIKKNAELNNLRVAISNKNANLLLQENFSAFNFIDIDPFGTPVPFLDSAVMTSNGYLGMTATDTAPLCGVYPKACLRKYSAKPLRSEFCHEVGLRILLGYAARTCAKYSKGMKCLLSHSTEHYFRAYVRLLEGKKKADAALEELGYVYYCKNCLSHEYGKGSITSKKCKCGSKYEVAGPLWLGKIKNDEFCREVLQKSKYLEDKKLEKLLETITKELENPFYYDVHKTCKKLKIEVPAMEKILDKLKKTGYKASRTHFSLTSLKTSAELPVFLLRAKFA
ncbi:MAG: tRNA (guanine(10)-N(2))-dimethyltransferase [Candidatus Hydrothermarchaeota archaeon]|nr:tRNA (guanine(10)-N(2))-dimethyltransferase [Candidatus Hydrothermarchaeota archaeon]